MPSDKKQGFVEYSHGRPQSCPSTGCMEVMENGIGQMPLGVMLQGESERQEVLVKPAEAVAVPGLEHNWSTTGAQRLLAYCRGYGSILQAAVWPPRQRRRKGYR
jgi:hypothetical protein